MVHLWAGVHGEDEDFSVGLVRSNLFCGGEAIEFRHRDIKDGEIGLELQTSVDGLLTIFSLSTHLQVASRLQE